MDFLPCSEGGVGNRSVLFGGACKEPALKWVCSGWGNWAPWVCLRAGNGCPREKSQRLVVPWKLPGKVFSLSLGEGCGGFHAV